MREKYYYFSFMVVSMIMSKNSASFLGFDLEPLRSESHLDIFQSVGAKSAPYFGRESKLKFVGCLRHSRGVLSLAGAGLHTCDAADALALHCCTINGTYQQWNAIVVQRERIKSQTLLV